MRGCVDANMAEDTQIPMLLRGLGDHDLSLWRVKAYGAAHVDALSGVGGTRHDILAVSDSGDHSSQGAWRICDAQLRKWDFITDRKSDCCVQARFNELFNGLWVANRAHHDVLQPLLEGFVQDIHIVTGAARHTVVAVIQQ